MNHDYSLKKQLIEYFEGHTKKALRDMGYEQFSELGLSNSGLKRLKQRADKLYRKDRIKEGIEKGKKVAKDIYSVLRAYWLIPTTARKLNSDDYEERNLTTPVIASMITGIFAPMIGGALTERAGNSKLSALLMITPLVVNAIDGCYELNRYIKKRAKERLE